MHGRRGVTKEFIVEFQKYEFVVSLVFRIDRLNPPAFAYEVKSIRLSSETKFRIPELTVPHGVLFTRFFNDDSKAEMLKLALEHAGKCANVSKDKLCGTWELGQRTSGYDPENKSDFDRVFSIFNNEFRRKRIDTEKMKACYEKIVNRFEAALTVQITDAIRGVSNETLRGCHNRTSYVYESFENDRHNILDGLFPNRWKSEAAYEDVFIDTGILKIPHARHDACICCVVTFGLSPYPFAVLKIVKLEAFGTHHLTRGESMHAVAFVDNKFVTCPLNVSHTAAEAQLEMAAVLGITAEIANEADKAKVEPPMALQSIA